MKYLKRAGMLLSLLFALTVLVGCTKSEKDKIAIVMAKTLCEMQMMQDEMDAVDDDDVEAMAEIAEKYENIDETILGFIKAEGYESEEAFEEALDKYEEDHEDGEQELKDAVISEADKICELSDDLVDEMLGE